MCYNGTMFWKILIVFLVSMVPIIELRGAVPIGVGLDTGWPYWALLIVAIIGNMLPVPAIYFLAQKVLKWGKKCKIKWFSKFCIFCLEKGKKVGDKMLKTTKGATYFALYLFVAIPIPGTGAWTGTLAASILDLDFKKTALAVVAGVITAGIIMLLISLGLFKAITG